ncbi:MAG TPA: hypothetical protein VE089_02605 [Nitrososphaeraceae archaeon]|jgi:hypothetical protein|nr:hypothetical protein [Nitrososphaeraceae archaeon]
MVSKTINLKRDKALSRERDYRKLAIIHPQIGRIMLVDIRLANLNVDPTLVGLQAIIKM